MNFLAHAYLSGNNLDIAVGNLIGDTVKGNKYKDFSKDIRIGLLLHRSIDAFTDAHPEFKAAVEIIKPNFGRYSGIVCDIYFDHFLAKHWSVYAHQSLPDFVNNLYIHLIKTSPVLPPRAQRISAFMIIRDWLGTYHNFDNLHQVFLGMHNRTSKKGDMDMAVDVLKKHYQALETHFFNYMPEVSDFAAASLIEIQNCQ